MTLKVYFLGIGLLSLLTAALMFSTPVWFRLFMAGGGVVSLAVALYLIRAQQEHQGHE